MKYSITSAALMASLAAPAFAEEGVRSKRFQMQAVTIASNTSLGHIWTESKDTGASFPDHYYGDEAFDVMFRQQHQNFKPLYLHDLYKPEGSEFWISCARASPSPCWGSGALDVAGGVWEAGHYIVDALFRYDDKGFEPEKGWAIENYDRETGLAEMVYNGPKAPYAFYSCGDAPATEDDEPNGDLVIKYASEQTPAECQDVRLQVSIGKDLDDYECHIDPGCQNSYCSVC